MNDTDSAEDTLPSLQLRMVVEHTYCPRLFHYMQVEGLMEANAHVWRGRAGHVATDKRGSTRGRRQPMEDAPVEDDRPDDWREARAVDVSMPSLGLAGRLDGVLLDTAGTAVPTEIKSGDGPEPDRHATAYAQGVWDADAVHVGLQCLALEVGGHVVPHGEIYYQSTRRRAKVPWDDNLRAVAHDAVVRARAALTATIRPAPLEDSPKCRGCSLQPVCLPDESARLRELTEAEALDGAGEEGETAPTKWKRRLTAPAGELRSVTVSTAGSSVRKDGEALVLVPPPGSEQKLSRIALDAVSAIALYGNVQVSTQCLVACMERGIGVSFHTSTGRLAGGVSTGLGNNASLRAKQHAAAEDPTRATELAKGFVRGKLRNQRTFLRRQGTMRDEVANELVALLRGVDDASDLDTLRGLEGRGARVYFEDFGALLRERGGEAFAPRGRSRRPPKDRANALLSFGYAILARVCADAARRVGFDPMRGFLHGMGWGRPALGLDLMEEFRPLVVDSTVLRVIAEKRIVAGDFHEELGAFALRPDARRTFLQALDQRFEETVTHPVFGYQVRYRDAVELQARVLVRVLDGETPMYVPLTTR
jgi:CRISPR-associated protein Cas1